jgi:hypothetical protein
MQLLPDSVAVMAEEDVTAAEAVLESRVSTDLLWISFRPDAVRKARMGIRWDSWEVGLIAESEPGDLSPGPDPPDYRTGYLGLQNGRLSFLAGRFRAGIGSGLLFGRSSFGGPTRAAVTPARLSAQRLTGYAGSARGQGMRGIAVRADLRPASLTAWLSREAVDVRTDSLRMRKFFRSAAVPRSRQSERVRTTSTGVSLFVRQGRLRAGITGALSVRYADVGVPYQEEPLPRRNPQAEVFAAWIGRRVRVDAAAAHSIARSGTLGLSLRDGALLVHSACRMVSPRFHARHAAIPSAFGNPLRGEQGCSLGMRLARAGTVVAAARDVARNVPDRVDAASPVLVSEYRLELSGSDSGARFSRRARSRVSTVAGIAGLETDPTARIRLWHGDRLGKHVHLRADVASAFADAAGASLALRILLTIRASGIQLFASVYEVHVPDRSPGIALYEPGPRFGFPIIQFSRNVRRYAAAARVDLGAWSLEAQLWTEVPRTGTGRSPDEDAIRSRWAISVGRRR